MAVTSSGHPPHHEAPPRLAITGSIARDVFRGPDGTARERLGGSAVYAALAARLVAPVAVLGVRGADIDPLFEPLEGVEALDLSGVARVPHAPSESWTIATTHEGARSVGGHLPGVAAPGGPPSGSVPVSARFLFCGSLAPARQLAAIESAPPGCLVAFDTMVDHVRADRAAVEAALERSFILLATMPELHALVPDIGNPAEGALMRWGLEAVVEKAGAAGCCLVTHGGQLPLSAHPGPVSDPTGAGDALAGAFLAVLASASPPLGPGWVSGRVGEPMLRHALAMGMAAASLACSAEGCDALLKATPADLAARLAHWGIGAVNPRFA